MTSASPSPEEPSTEENKFPELVGKYIYGDYVTGLLWALEHDGTKTVANYSLNMVEGDKLPIMSFGEDEGGEVYFATTFGQLYKFKSLK